jgi:hypothetical protein
MAVSYAFLTPALLQINVPQLNATVPLGEDTEREARKPSVNERLKDILNKPREKLEIEDEREQGRDQEVENERQIDRDIDRDPGLSH